MDPRASDASSRDAGYDGSMRNLLSTPAYRLYLAALVILIAGWVAAGFVFVSAVDDGDAAGSVAIVGGQAYAVASGDAKSDAASERLNGKTGVRVAGFDAWLGSLWHGERLAWTLAASSAVVAVLFAYIAGLMAEEEIEPVND